MMNSEFSNKAYTDIERMAPIMAKAVCVLFAGIPPGLNLNENIST